MSKFEKKALDKINLTEGLLKSILLTLTGSKFKKAIKALQSSREDLKAQGYDLEAYSKEFERQIKNFCKENPKEPICKK